MRRPAKNDTVVPIPPLRGDEWHCMTVLPYLFDHYYDSPDQASNGEYFTERDLNGKQDYLSWKNKIHFISLEEMLLKSEIEPQNNGSAQTNNQSSKRRWKKPISCITVRRIPGCKQS